MLTEQEHSSTFAGAPCAGWSVNSDGSLVRCPKLVRQARRRYHAKSCYTRTWKLKKNGLHLGSVVKRRRECIGWVEQKGVLVGCGELFLPRNSTDKYHSTNCCQWTRDRRRSGLRLGDAYVKGRTINAQPKICIGWALRNGVITSCGEIFLPDHANHKYHSADCERWTCRRREQGLHLGDLYSKHKRVRCQLQSKTCSGWTIRDGVIAMCSKPFQAEDAAHEYHSQQCREQTGRWKKKWALKLGMSVRKQCAYRKCTKGEDGGKKLFDRIKAGRRGSNQWFCCRLHAHYEAQERRLDRIREQAKAEALVVGKPKGKPGRKPKKRELFLLGGQLYEQMGESGSWPQVARKLVPTDYAINPEKAGEKLRLGYEYHKQLMGQPSSQKISP